MSECFLDTNILIRHLVQDHEDHSPDELRIWLGDPTFAAFNQESGVFVVSLANLKPSLDDSDPANEIAAAILKSNDQVDRWVSSSSDTA